MSDFDFDSLCDRVVAAAKQAFAEIVAAHPQERFTAFALYSDGGAMTVCPALCTARFLATKAAEEPEEYLFYKYSPSEWPFEGQGADQVFGAICKTIRDYLGYDRFEEDEDGFDRFKSGLIEMCVQAQERLLREFFTAQGEDFLLLVTLSDDDEPAEELCHRVVRLNRPAIAQEFSAWTKSWGQ